MKELQKNKIRKIKVRQWLLLALRVLIIFFIIAAFARPALKGVRIGGTTSSAKTTAVFILDNSFSMSVVSNKGSYFNQAKQTLKTLLDELQEGDETALVLVSDSSNNIIQPTTNLINLRKNVDDAEISNESGTMHNAIVKASEILGESKNFNKEIYILSDFQKSRLTNPKETVSDLGNLLDENVKLYSFDFAGKDVFNVGIDSLQVNNQIFEKDKPISFTATVTNYSDRPVNNFVASLFINGERSAQQSVSLDKGQSTNVLFETVLKSTGYVNVVAELEDDDILQDNKKYLDLVIPEKINVVIFTDTNDDSKFIRLALGADSSERNIEVTEKNLNQVSSVNLNNFDVVIISGSQNLDNINRLKEFLTSGGSLFLMPGSKTKFAHFKDFAVKLGLPSPVSAAGNPDSPKSYAVFDKIDYNHPIFTNIFEKTAKKQVETPEIYYYFKINTQGKGKEIISLLDNTSFLSEYRIGKGKVLLMNTAPVLSWSNLPLKGIFVPLMNKAVYYLASKDNQISSYIAGETVDINLQNSTIPQIKIEKPGNRNELININKNIFGNYFDYSKTAATGNYKIYSGENLIDHFSINTNPLESNTTTLSRDDFSKYLKKINFKGESFNFDPSGNYTAEIQQARFGSELWKILLFTALILALIEMMIARSAKKDLALD